MKLVFVLALIVLAAADTDYETVLRSPGKLKFLFSEFSGNFKKHFSRAEAPLRIRIFRKDLKRIVQLNKEHAGQWTSGLNEFTTMTEEEKSHHLGLNISSVLPAVSVPSKAVPSIQGGPGKDWRKEGKVTGVKNQGECGACWSYSAVATLETNYAIVTGRRKQFSEQEYLDCTYESEGGKDGCVGGWYFHAWFYSMRTGRLATLAAAPYKGKDGVCSYNGVHNGLIAAKIGNLIRVPTGENAVINVLNTIAISVAYEVTDDFFKYTGGIISDDTCKSLPNHAVTAVGYTDKAMILKNSWGAWGMNGYFYTARNHHGCQIYKYGVVPIMKSTGKPDTDPEYVPKDDDKCSGANTDGCPCGTVRCGNGKCKHAHMCH